MRVEEIRDVAGLEVLRPEWDALFRRSPEAPPFVSPAWLVAWWRHLGGGELRTLALRQDGRLVAVAPLFAYAEGERRRLAFLGSGVSDELDLLSEPDLAQRAADAVVDHLLAAQEWDRASFDALPAGSPLLGPRAPAPTSVTQAEACQALVLPACPREFDARLTPHHRRNLRRARRLLEAQGALHFGRVPAREGVQALLALHGARWAGRGEAGVLATPALAAFTQEAALGLERSGLLRMRALRVGGRIAALMYGFARSTRAYAYLSGFDPGLAQASPGTLLTAWAIEDSIAEGVTRFDFLRGDEPHKSRWRVRPVPHYRVEVRRCASC